jgi:hypothetical protein
MTCGWEGGGGEGWEGDEEKKSELAIILA